LDRWTILSKYCPCPDVIHCGGRSHHFAANSFVLYKEFRDLLIAGNDEKKHFRIKTNIQ